MEIILSITTLNLTCSSPSIKLLTYHHDNFYSFLPCHFLSSFTTKGNNELFFASRFEERVATAIVDAVTETDRDSVGGVDSADGVDSFDVGGTAAGADSSAVDDDSDAAAGTFILYPS